jgi:eukaryotic-like serine/threonine-protein kinase
MLVKLRVNAGPKKGKEYIFDEPQGFTFGRAEDCSCVVEEDETFSRYHFLLEINPPQVWIQDLGSLNGTYINRRKIGSRPTGVAVDEAEPGEAVALRDGDLITAGVHELLLMIEAPVICVDCGQEVLPVKRREAEFIGGTYLCEHCRTSRTSKDREKQKVGLRLNPEQRKKAEDNPIEIIEDLLKQYQDQGGGKEEYPEIRGYSFQEKLGEGGFGAVYAAVRLSDGKQVAVKTLLQTRRPDQRQLNMFIREKEIVSQLRHPNVVHSESVSNIDDLHFIEMEYMSGGCVGKLLKNRGKLALLEAAPIMLQALEGLTYIHQAEVTLSFEGGKKPVKGIIHRDLKPFNILLSGQPGKWTAKLSDFGLSKAFSETGFTKGSITSPGMTIGSWQYTAPEHLVNYRYLKPPTDVFELAATFYHMLTGSFVWNLSHYKDNIFRVILQSSPEPIRNRDSTIPYSVAKVIDRALSCKPEQRYRDGGEFLSAFKEALPKELIN